MLVLVLKIQVVWILDGKQDSELQRAFAVGNFSLEGPLWLVVFRFLVLKRGNAAPFAVGMSGTMKRLP